MYLKIVLVGNINGMIVVLFFSFFLSIYSGLYNEIVLLL